MCVCRVWFFLYVKNLLIRLFAGVCVCVRECERLFALLCNSCCKFTEEFCLYVRIVDVNITLNIF